MRGTWELRLADISDSSHLMFTLEHNLLWCKTSPSGVVSKPAHMFKLFFFLWSSLYGSVQLCRDFPVFFFFVSVFLTLPFYKYHFLLLNLFYSSKQFFSCPECLFVYLSVVYLHYFQYSGFLKGWIGEGVGGEDL